MRVSIYNLKLIQKQSICRDEEKIVKILSSHFCKRADIFGPVSIQLDVVFSRDETRKWEKVFGSWNFCIP